MKNLLGITTALLAILAGATGVSALQATFTPRASVTEQYTSNVFLDENDEKDDWLTIGSVGFTLGLLGRNSGLELSYDPAYAYYLEFDENNSWRHAARLRSWSQFTKNTRLEVGDDFLRSEDTFTREEIDLIRGEDPLLELDPTIRRGRNTYTRNVARVQGTYTYGAQNEIYLGYINNLDDNSSKDEEDSMGHNPYIGFAYWLNPINALEGRGDYTYGDYEDSDNFDDYMGMLRFLHRIDRQLSGFVQYNHTYRNYDGDTSSYMVYEPSVGITYDIETDINLLLRAGYFYQDLDDGNDASGPSGEATLTKLWPRARLELGASGGYDRSDFDSENLGFEKYYQGNVFATYQFTRRLSGDVIGLYRNTKYEDTADDREDDFFIGGAGVTLQTLEWMFFRVGYDFRHRDSNVDGDSYDEHRGQITITLQPPQPYRWSD